MRGGEGFREGSDDGEQGRSAGEGSSCMGKDLGSMAVGAKKQQREVSTWRIKERLGLG